MSSMSDTAGDEQPELLSPTVQLWDHLAQPVDPWTAAEALVGMSHGAARMLAAILLLSSPEAESLLDALPRLTRCLAISTTSRSERSSGELRGPILWAETMAARAASAGDGGCFIYSVAARAYDTAENRVLVGALKALADAGRTVDTSALRERDSDLARLLNERGGAARMWLEHRALGGVPKGHVRTRDRQRTRAATRRPQYAVATELLDRHSEPLTAEDLALVADLRTRAQHRGIITLVAGLAARGVPLPPFNVHNGILASGPLVYIHDRSRRGRAERRGGIFLNDHAIDVPAVLDGRLVRVGIAAPSEPAHLFLGSAGDLDPILDAAGL